MCAQTESAQNRPQKISVSSIEWLKTSNLVCIFIEERNPITQAASSIWSLRLFGWRLTGSHVATASERGTDQTCSKVTKQWWTPLMQVNGNPLLTYHEIIWDEGLLTSSEPNRASHIEISIHVSILPCLWCFTQSERMHKRSKVGWLCSAISCSDSVRQEINPVDERTFIFPLLKSNYLFNKLH